MFRPGIWWIGRGWIDPALVFVARETVRGGASAGEVGGRRDVRELLAQPIVAVGAEALDRGLRDRAVHSPDPAVRPWISAWSAGGRCRRPGGSCRSEWMVFRLRGRAANGLPLSVRDPTGRSLDHLPEKRPGGLSAAVATRWTTANWAVRSMPANRWRLPSAVCASAISMWRRPMGYRSNVWRLHPAGARCHGAEGSSADRVRCGIDDGRA
ncbi:hypothetical protein PARU111607_08335 [Palleronia rufa]